MKLNLTPEQLAAALFAIREQAHQNRQVACDRRRAGDQLQFAAAQCQLSHPDVHADRIARMDHMYASAYGLEQNAKILDSVADAMVSE